MPSRPDRPAHRIRHLLTSTRFRALLALGMVLGVGGVSTLAAWSGSATAKSGDIVTGTIDLQLTSTGQTTMTKTLNLSELGMTGMAAGNSKRTTVNVKNNVSAATGLPLKYTLTSTTTGELARFLKVTVATGTTAANCTGGIQIATALTLTTTPDQPITPAGQTRSIPVGGSEPLCISVQMPVKPSALTPTVSANMTLNFKAVV
ncbi:hypothetical protein EEB12_08300 [Rhodococcus sp. WS1]|jgi:predicted ribosomally synthesized peptide with SipW-like signal peptide|uniref:Uncharacterized protein n=1 Tax=Rhodococcus erythropolis TaxID=1833 RepID=A0A5P3G532_RHOER|nr:MULTISPECIES: SipW-dependent-type signal peptide-containing protein [Rhodococcus]MDN3457064.1 SipW-dependent-type signal peptide-containing protein [Rhodococcus sp. APC 3903]ORI31449.1 hypothetical protein BH686_03505 [Rhodococcus erythropolis]QEX09911.1 hypothetical protein F6X56_09465 [Rhodococcus erythropolis]QIP38838.1 hypothetical protein G9444_1594 [Rhodococcus erythropolis]ROZ59913.1 hypothetical protein EEB12_08300 [Rhodococcus sp. WS1]